MSAKQLQATTVYKLLEIEVSYISDFKMLPTEL